MPPVKTATASDEAFVIDMMVLAFSADPAARWTWSDPQQYLAHFRHFARAFGGKAFTHGVHTSLTVPNAAQATLTPKKNLPICRFWPAWFVVAVRAQKIGL